MNINDYRRGMDRIAPNPKLKERIMENTNEKKRIPVRRVVHAALAAAVAAACLFTVAFAASPELRTAVLSFLRVEEHEQVPNSSAGPGGPDISQAEIGQLVKAQYIRMEQNTFGRGYSYFDGLLSDLEWSEDRRTLLSYKFVEIQDGELVPIQVDMRTNVIDITYDGIRYQGELYWFVRNGQLFTTKGTPYGVDTRPEDGWYIEPIPGRTDAVLLKLSQGRQMDYSEYPVLYHLDTGEAEDILAGTGVDAVEYAYAYDWSDDMRHALILCSPTIDGQQTWLCDRKAKTLTRLEDLAGIGAQFANFLDDNTLNLTAYGVDPQDNTFNTITCWAYDISSGQAVKTVDQLPYYRWWDEVPCGASLYNKNCIYVSETGQVAVINLKTGERIPVEGFTYQAGDRFMPSPSGNKLLYYSSAPEADGLGISQIGVVDLEKGTFIAFDREGYENLHEEAIGWEDDNTVGINARTLDGETQYLLLYQF